MMPPFATVSMDMGHKDPRGAPGFIPQHYPTANGQAAPLPDSAARNDIIMLEFLAIYYRLNCEYAQLRQIRQSPPSAERHQNERHQLQAVEQLLIARDGLEDFYAPYGIVVEPVVQDGFTRDLRFEFGGPAPGQHRRDEAVLIEAILPLALPSDFDLQNLPIQVHVARNAGQLSYLLPKPESPRPQPGPGHDKNADKPSIPEKQPIPRTNVQDRTSPPSHDL